MPYMNCTVVHETIHGNVNVQIGANRTAKAEEDQVCKMAANVQDQTKKSIVLLLEDQAHQQSHFPSWASSGTYANDEACDRRNVALNC